MCLNFITPMVHNLQKYEELHVCPKILSMIHIAKVEQSVPHISRDGTRACWLDEEKSVQYRPSAPGPQSARFGHCPPRVQYEPELGDSASQ